MVSVHSRRSSTSSYFPHPVRRARLAQLFHGAHRRGKYWSGVRASCEPLFHTAALEGYAPAMNQVGSAAGWNVAGGGGVCVV